MWFNPTFEEYDERSRDIMKSIKLFIPLHFISWKKRLQTMLWHNNARVNSHQRWKQTQFRVCFHLWCELTSTLSVMEWQVSWNSWIALDCHHAHFIVSGSNLYVGSRSWGSDPQPFLTLACNSRLQSGSDLTFNQRQLELVEKGFWLLCIVVLTYKRLPFDHCHMWNDYDNIWLVNWYKMVYVVLWVNNVCYPIWHKLEQKSYWKIAVCTHWLYIGSSNSIGKYWSKEQTRLG